MTAPEKHLEKSLALSNFKLSLLLALGWFIYFPARLGRDPLNLDLDWTVSKCLKVRSLGAWDVRTACR